MPRVIIAPDKFKGSLTAAAVAASVAAGVRRACPHAEVVAAPVADGGDGTVAAALAAGFTAVPVTAAGPTGEPVDTCYARRGDVAVVEMADVSGLMRLPGRRFEPMRATSRGTGEMVAAAVDAGCRHVILGIGGSASTDGGAALAGLATVDLSGVRARVDGVRVTVACDVDNPLTGPHGAAATYGPQKGAAPEQVDELDRALAHWARLAVSGGADGGAGHREGCGRTGAPGAGAAGGVGFAALALLGAEPRPGIDLVLDLVGCDEHLRGADLVVTGEGSLDEQTLRGKARALDIGRLHAVGIVAAYALTDLGTHRRTHRREPPERPSLPMTGSHQ